MHALKFVAGAVDVPGEDADVLGFAPHAPSTKPIVTTPATTTVIPRTRRKAFSLPVTAVRETVPPPAIPPTRRGTRVTESWPSDQHVKDGTA
jgi:hypothetical protein